MCASQAQAEDLPRVAVLCRLGAILFETEQHHHDTMSTYRELLEQKKALDQQIAAARKAEAATALESVHALIAEFGFTAQQVFPWKGTSKKPRVPAQKVPAKYRDPATGATWTGRGKAPNWIAGKERQEFLI